MNASFYLFFAAPFVAALVIYVMALFMPGWIALAAYAVAMPFVIAGLGYYALISTAHLPYFVFIMTGGIAAAATAYVAGLAARAVMLAFPALGYIGKTTVALLGLAACYPLYGFVAQQAFVLLATLIQASQPA